MTYCKSGKIVPSSPKGASMIGANTANLSRTNFAPLCMNHDAEPDDIIKEYCEDEEAALPEITISFLKFAVL